MPKPKDWFHCDELMKRWNLNEYQIWSLVIEAKLTLHVQGPSPEAYERREPLNNTGFIEEMHGSLKNFLNHARFSLEDVEKLEKERLEEGTDLAGRKLRPNQRHRKLVRGLAEKIWSMNPEITIADMVKNGEIKKIAVTKKGKNYEEKTLHDWIKDLCPNRYPGRRPKRT